MEVCSLVETPALLAMAAETEPALTSVVLLDEIALPNLLVLLKGAA